MIRVTIEVEHEGTGHDFHIACEDAFRTDEVASVSVERLAAQAVASMNAALKATP